MNGASSDSTGRFSFEDLEPRTYRLSFQKPAYEAETREFPATEDGREVRVELRRGEGLALEARDGIYGTPLRGLFVRVLDAGGAAVFTGSVPLDSTGRGGCLLSRRPATSCGWTRRATPPWCGRGCWSPRPGSSSP